MLTAADTAYSIAFVRAREGERPAPERLFEDPYAGIFAAAGDHASEGTRRFLELPFFLEAVRLRTRYIDDFVREGLRSGVDQVVLLGAGFDARGLRMPELATHGACVYEVDLEHQLEQKRRLLHAACVELPERIRHVACDFNAPEFDVALTTGLVACGFRVGSRALFVWEGVIAYVGTEARDRTLRWVVRAGGPGSRLVFDFAPIAFEPDTGTKLMLRAGFKRFEKLGYDEIWRRYFCGEPPPHASIACIGTAFV